MSSDHQSDLGKDTAGNGTGGSKAFARSPLEYGSSLLGAGSPSYESRLPYKRYGPPYLAYALTLCGNRAREIQQQEGVPAMFWSSSIGSSNSSPGAKTPVEPSIPEGNLLQPLHANPCTPCLTVGYFTDDRHPLHRDFSQYKTSSCRDSALAIHE